MLILLALLEFPNFKFLPLVRSDLIFKVNWSSILMKISKTNNETTLFLMMQMKFEYFNFWHPKAQFVSTQFECKSTSILTLLLLYQIRSQIRSQILKAFQLRCNLVQWSFCNILLKAFQLRCSLVQWSFCNILRTTHVKELTFSGVLANISKVKNFVMYLKHFEKQHMYSNVYVL